MLKMLCPTSTLNHLTFYYSTLNHKPPNIPLFYIKPHSIPSLCVKLHSIPVLYIELHNIPLLYIKLLFCITYFESEQFLPQSHCSSELAVYFKADTYFELFLSNFLRKQRLLSRTNPKEDQQKSRGIKPSSRFQETPNLEIPGVGLARHMVPPGTDEHDHTGGNLNVSANSSNVHDNNSATYFQRSTLHNRNPVPRNRTEPEFMGNDPVLEVTSTLSSSSANVTGREHNVPYCHGNDHSVQDLGNEQNVPNHGNENFEPSRHGNKQMVHHHHGNQRQHSNLSDFDLRHFAYSQETSQGETGHISIYNRSLSVENVFGHQGTLVGNRNEHDRKLYRNCPAQEIPNSNHTVDQRILHMNNMLCTPADILR